MATSKSASPEALKFIVRRSSPPIPGFTASELEAQSPDTKGFLTGYIPGEVILDLLGAPKFDLAQMQFLAHEAKIPTRIDVAASESVGSPFKNLGYLELKDNEETGFMARELQCVKVECRGVTQIKLTFHKAHKNALNLEGHVGLVALNILGWKVSAPVQSIPAIPHAFQNEMRATIDSPRRSLPTPSPLLSGASDPLVSLTKRLEDARKAKESAVSKEEYEEAQRHRADEDRLRDILEKIQEFDQAKKAAVGREEYDLAASIKQKIDSLLLSSSVAVGVKQASAQSPIRQSINAVEQQSSSPPVPAHQARASAVKAVPSTGKTEEEDGPPRDFWKDIPNSDVLPIAESVDVHLAMTEEARQITSAFNEYTARCVYSSDVRLRCAITTKLARQVENSRSQISTNQLSALLSVIAIILTDSAPHAVLEAIRLLDVLLSRVSTDKAKGSSTLKQAITAHLVNALGNANEHVVEEAIRQLLRLAEWFGVGSVMGLVLKSSSRKSSLWRPLNSRLTVVLALVQSATVEETSRWTPDVLTWMKDNSCFAHANDQVNELALEVTKALYLKTEDRFEIEDFLRNTAKLRQSTLERYFDAFSASGRRGPLAASHAKLSNEKQSPHKKLSQTSKKEEHVVQEDPTVCSFCGERDELFENQRVLDKHWWGECAMLVTCPHCEQVVEVSHLNEHLLDECKQKHNHRECPRCGEAIAAQALEKHVQRKSCLPKKPIDQANRCPLCHDDVAPFDVGWRTHLLVDQCPNNIRTLDIEEDEEGDDQDY